MGRALGVALVLWFATLTFAERVILIPLDSRPAAGHFAQMIARMAGVEVSMPPYELLGRFTQPGKPDEILTWLRDQDFSDVVAVVVSTDMVAYGGLVASRVPDTTTLEAERRLRRLAIIRSRHPKVQFYGFSAVMRLFPTSTRANAAWRLQLGRYAELKERFERTGEPASRRSMQNLLTRIPPLEIARYEETRARNHEIQRLLIRLTRSGTFDYLILGQDDAQPFGPHIPEQRALARYIAAQGVQSKVYQCEGIDQHANVLVSRALLRRSGWTPRVRIVFSDPAGRHKIANYESKNVENSLRDQILASGARPAINADEYDYTLYVNTPDPRPDEFANFLVKLKEDVDQGFPVAVADINLGKDGTADPRLFAGLMTNERMVRLLSYAGWNTAGNTMGTAIPTANVYLLARRMQVDPLVREVARREFLLHRYVNDFEYHRHVRPLAYQMIDEMPRASREEAYGAEFADVDQFVRDALTQHLERVFREQFLGRPFFAGTGQFVVSGLDNVRVFLPWPRVYEVRLEFRMQAVSAAEWAASQSAVTNGNGTVNGSDPTMPISPDPVVPIPSAPPRNPNPDRP